MTTNRYTVGVKQNHWPRFNKKLWQRNYYEHVIRSELSLQKIREYIVYNPINWQDDDLNDNPHVGAGPRACPSSTGGLS